MHEEVIGYLQKDRLRLLKIISAALVHLKVGNVASAKSLLQESADKELI